MCKMFEYPIESHQGDFRPASDPLVDVEFLSQTSSSALGVLSVNNA
jgi:hypothetical protein